MKISSKIHNYLDYFPGFVIEISNFFGNQQLDCKESRDYLMRSTAVPIYIGQLTTKRVGGTDALR